jgi:hypothetical protein
VRNCAHLRERTFADLAPASRACPIVGPGWPAGCGRSRDRSHLAGQLRPSLTGAQRSGRRNRNSARASRTFQRRSGSARRRRAVPGLDRRRALRSISREYCRVTQLRAARANVRGSRIRFAHVSHRRSGLARRMRAVPGPLASCGPTQAVVDGRAAQRSEPNSAFASRTRSNVGPGRPAGGGRSRDSTRHLALPSVHGNTACAQLRAPPRANVRGSRTRFARVSHRRSGLARRMRAVPGPLASCGPTQAVVGGRAAQRSSGTPHALRAPVPNVGPGRPAGGGRSRDSTVVDRCDHLDGLRVRNCAQLRERTFADLRTRFARVSHRRSGLARRMRAVPGPLASCGPTQAVVDGRAAQRSSEAPHALRARSQRRSGSARRRRAVPGTCDRRRALRSARREYCVCATARTSASERSRISHSLRARVPTSVRVGPPEAGGPGTARILRAISGRR